MNCTNLKKKLNGKCYCKVLKKEIQPRECTFCEFRTIKQPSEINYTLKGKTSLKMSKNRLKKYTTKRRKLEESRFSVFTIDLTTCYFHKDRTKDDLHELIFGRNRYNSIKYGFVLPVCRECHDQLHNDCELQLFWKRKCQDYYEKNVGTTEQFIEIFKKNYKK